MVFTRVSALAAILMLLAGCSTMPSSGPSIGDIEAVGNRPALSIGRDLELIKLDNDKISLFESYRPQTLAGVFPQNRPSPRQTIGIGDVVSVTIFEAAGGGLFSQSDGGGSKYVSLPVQMVQANGTIGIPYAGRLSVTGKTVEEVEADVVSRLDKKAIEPQVMVSLKSNESHLATVDGDVARAGRIPLSPKGDRLLDVLASAGGAKGDPSENYVRLTRGGRLATAPMLSLLDDPTQNIYVWPEDQIFVFKKPQSFTAIGASGRSGTYKFPLPTMTLAEAIGTAAGINGTVGEPAGVFIFRREKAEIACRLENEAPCRDATATRSVIYQLNMREPAGIALAQRMMINDKDVLYVASADSSQLNKFLRMLSTILAPTYTATAVYTKFD